MSIYRTLLKIKNQIKRKMEIKGYRGASIPREEQLEFLKGLGKPRDNIERAFFQYKCKMKLQESSTHILNQIIFNICCLLGVLMAMSIPFKGKNKKTRALNTAFYTLEAKRMEIIPKSIHKEFLNIVTVDQCNKLYLSREDKKYILSIWRRYPLYFEFLLQGIIKIGIYSNAIKQFGVSAVITANEYSFTSSLLTSYCRTRGIIHINVMHGNAAFEIRSGFFSYDRCYVWEGYYKELFLKLGAAENQFYIEKPEFLFLKNSCRKKITMYKYFLAGENEMQLHIIRKELLEITDKGKTFMVRPHPRWTDFKMVEGIFSEREIEYPVEKKIEDSISDVEYVIAQASTVLYQASLNEIKIIIDDVTNPERFEELKRDEYIMLSKPHFLLSEFKNPELFKSCRNSTKSGM